jgi:phosphatidylglycerol lysyltransferase
MSMSTNAPSAEPSSPIASPSAAWARVIKYSRTVFPLVVFGGVLWLLYVEFNKFSPSEVHASLQAISPFAILAAIVLTACNYVVLVGYDWLGTRMVQHPVSFKQVTIASLLSYAFSNSLGFILGGTPVRAKLYSDWGMPSSEVVRLVLMIGFAFWAGMLALGGILFVVTPFDIPSRFHLPLATSQPIGLAMLAIVGAMFAASLFRRKPLSVCGVNVQPPPAKIMVAQSITAAFDFILTAAVLYVLLPQESTIAFFPFVAIFLLAIVVSLVTHVPGGLGVLELVLVTMLPETSSGVVASLLAFRVIYYLLPLAIAVSAVSLSIVKKNWQRTRAIAANAGNWNSLISPKVVTVGVFIAGIVLLVSGSVPSAEGRMQMLGGVMPLPIVEMSHFVGSVAGALLLVLAGGLRKRVDAAWVLTIALLAIGVIASLAKGFDYEEAAVLSLLLLALLPCRSHFYRKGRLLDTSSSVGWATLAPISLGLVIWLVLFSYRDVQYSDDLWWEFAYSSDAPRSLRALVGAAVVFLIVGVRNLMCPTAERPQMIEEDNLDEVAAIVKTSRQANASLALLGDKRFVFSKDRKAFVMFGCEGKSWIAMGDPVGAEESVDDAAWQFREACDKAGVLPVFYQVNESALGRYIEMGLKMIKLGETARVRLKDFSLVGSAKKDIRYTNKKAGEWGLKFEIIPQAEVAERLPTLRAISDAWLNEKSAAEKRFSLGNFSDSYLCRGDVAIAIHNGEVIAFANLWQSADKHEMSIDLMRYRPGSPHGVMEYLFTQLMMWGREQGYEWFDLGMAPLSGLDSHRLGPMWNRISSLLFKHGEQFYNFKGLRSYKSKFGPEWFPKYLASPGGIATPQILANVSTLISGGVSELFRRRTA